MEYKYEPEDFEDLLFNVHNVPKKESILNHFPDLKKYPEFTAVLDTVETHKDKIIRYIVFMYDRNTPLLEIDDYNKRKIKAVQLAGCRSDNDGYFAPWTREMLGGKNREINAMIIRYCRIQQSREYALLVVGNEAYYNILLDITSTETGNKDPTLSATKKQELFMKAGAMNKEIEAMTSSLLNEAPDPELEKDLFKVIEAESVKNVKFSPEVMAKV